ncbi:MAG: hypothetical protein JRF63_02580 [Deltaproteobacteria bacterium]|nr:hypothetical protein [Deltaproteobacteria bacterium]
MGAREIIADIIRHDDRIASLRDELDSLPTTELKEALVEQISVVLQQTGQSDPLPLSLVRLVELACGLEQSAARILRAGLDSANADVRQLIGEALLTLTEPGIEPIMPAVEHALEAGGAAAEEMPFILAMIEDAGVPRVIERFLAADDSEVVASAIEALADAGDRSSIAMLEPLAADARSVSIDGGQGEATVSLGELAKEAMDVIAMDEED